ncbi:PIN domain-containing protein [Spirosoma soli]|uniref:PIN domain-containing protein n=1 Tax=Spirosoma soli TaxID=1770529 RepID=A0ABW5M974_9BACT
MNQYVLDANVLFSGVMSQKAIYRAMFDQDKYYTPDFVLAELNNYRKVFLKKSAVKGTDLKEFTLFLFSRIVVVPDYVITPDSYTRAELLVADIDPKDVAYVALNEELGTTLLTRDKPLYDGLRAKGYMRIRLFNDFIAEEITAQGGQ